MKNNIKELFESILYENKITKDQLHHIEVVYSCPDTWYTIAHKSGDKKKKSIFRKLFNLEAKVYSEPIVYSRYVNKEIPMSKVVQDFKDSTYIIKEDDQDNPIWFNNGIHIYLKDKYNNAMKCSNIFYIDKNIAYIEKLVAEVNCELYKDTLEFFGYRHIDLPEVKGVRFTEIVREPVLLQSMVELPLRGLKYNEEIFKNHLLHNFAESEDFKSLVKFERNTDNNGNDFLIGKVEILKDRD